MDLPTPVNKPVDTAEKVVHIAIFDIAAKAAVAAMQAQFPILKAPIISTLFNFTVGKFAGYFYEELSTFVAFSIISAQVESQRQDYEKAVDELKKAQISGDQDAINKARQDFKDNLRKLVRHNGS